MSNDMSEALDKLASTDAIKRLKHTYMTYCDLGYPPDKLGPLFADDAVWTSDIFGHHQGRAAIEEFFGGVSSEIVFAAHLALNGIIEVDGDRATGKWRLLMPCTLMEDGKKVARVMLGDYDEQYVRINGQWYFQKVDVFMNFNVQHNESWAEIAVARS